MDLALMNKNREAATALVRNFRWHEIMEQESGLFRSHALGMIEMLPEVFRLVMDRSISESNDEKTSQDYYVLYDFKYLQRKQSEISEMKKTSSFVPLMCLNVGVISISIRI